MNVLQVNQSDTGGGASVCANQLNELLPACGIESRMLVGHSTTEQDRVREIPAAGIMRRAVAFGIQKAGFNYRGISAPDRLLKHPFYMNADVIHLHNIHGSFFNYRWLSRMAAEKAVVWTWHDMWPMTGHCSYSLGCVRWREGCGQCPDLSIYPAMTFDFTRQEWRLKRDLYENSGIHVITPSQWLGDYAGDVSRGLKVSVISNGVDLGCYAPTDRTLARQELDLEDGVHVILYVSASVNNPFKGFEEFRDAIAELPEGIREKSVILVLGEGAESFREIGGVRVHAMGYVREAERKALAYNAADVFAFPTRADNQPLVIMEAMACGLPVVSSRIGGVPEMIQDGKTGWLAEAGDVTSFSECLHTALQGIDADIRRNCREHAATFYDERMHVKAVTSVYEQVLEKRRPS